MLRSNVVWTLLLFGLFLLTACVVTRRDATPKAIVVMTVTSTLQPTTTAVDDGAAARRLTRPTALTEVESVDREQATPSPTAAATVTATAPAPPTATQTPTATPTRSPVTEPYRGIWLTQEELQALPTTGTAWQTLQAAADRPLEEQDIGDQNAMGDVYLLAKALVYARTGIESYREEVLDGIEEAIGTEGRRNNTGILAIARNLPAYVIAADLVNLPADEARNEAFKSWLEGLRTQIFSGDGGSHSLITCHEQRPNNFGTHCGAARVAIALYLGDEYDLERAATVFEGWLGNREAYTGFVYGNLSWQANEERPVGINPAQAAKEGHQIGGALPEEMRRGGRFRWPPQKTGYAWEALQGAIVQAHLLSRAGYPAWEWEDQALLRAAQFLYDLGWEAEGDDEWQPWLINHVYGTDFSARSPARPGKNMGWTDWSHAQPPAGSDNR